MQNAPELFEYRNLEFEKRISVTRYANDGSPYIKSIGIGMPRITEHSKRCAFYLFNSVDAAKKSAPGGTGFFLSIPSDRHSHLSYCYGVTNAHVVANGTTVIRINGVQDNSIFYELDSADWEVHPDGYDIAVTRQPIPLDSKVHEIMTIGSQVVMTDEKALEIDLGIGDDVFMMGRFISQSANIKNEPAARFGNISVMPTPIKHKHTGKILPSYLLDMHSRTGFSGSPVFMFRTPGGNLDEAFRKNTNVIGPSYLLFLGIHWGQFTEELEFQFGNAKGAVEGFSGMTMVDPASAILELLNMEKFKKDRQQFDADQDSRDGIKLENAPTEASPVSGDDILKVMLNTPPTPHKGVG